MDTNIPYVLSATNIASILGKMQKAAIPETFNLDFLKDLGFTSSNDRPFLKVLKYLGFLDSAGRPQQPYRDFADQNKSKAVLAERMRVAFDDLFNTNPSAWELSTEDLKGWFKSKTGVGDAVAKKIAAQFRALAQYSDFKAVRPIPLGSSKDEKKEEKKEEKVERLDRGGVLPELGLVYRLEIHLPDTPNVETYRAIFKALREELGK
jgi:hypothetical protein